MLTRTMHVLAVAVALFCAMPVSAQWVWTPETGRFVNVGNLPKETPELQVEYARSLMLQERYGAALDETNKFFEFYGDTDLADENQFVRAEIRMRQGNYKKASEEYQQVIAMHPDTELFERVIARQYEIGDRLFEEGQITMARQRDASWWLPYKKVGIGSKRPLRRAIGVYNLVIDNQPFTAEAAEAQYKVGSCHFELAEYAEAAFEYRKVIEDYRGSEWVPEAGYGVARCYEEQSYSPDYDQVPSQLAIDAIDEFSLNYASDNRVDELQETRGEMREKIAEQRFQTGKFYERRQKLESARLYFEVVVGQYGDTRAADKARQWIENHPDRNRASTVFIGPAHVE